MQGPETSGEAHVCRQSLTLGQGNSERKRREHVGRLKARSAQPNKASQPYLCLPLVLAGRLITTQQKGDVHVRENLHFIIISTLNL